MKKWWKRLSLFAMCHFTVGCSVTKTKHGTCENCSEGDRRIWVYVYESGAGLNSESCQVCRPLLSEGGCLGVYEWSYGDSGVRSEGPYECAEKACAAEIESVEITTAYDSSTLFSQYDESDWTTPCDN